MTKRFGFTLAEVLITLGIIGVVAAMSIPTLISNTNSQKFRSQFKKTVATLNQAAIMSQAQYDFDFAGASAESSSTALDPRTSASVSAMLAGTLSGVTIGERTTTATLTSITLSNPITVKLADGSFFVFDGGNNSKNCTVAPGTPATSYLSALATGTSVAASTDEDGNEIPAQQVNKCVGYIDVNGEAMPNTEVVCGSGTTGVLAGNTVGECSVPNDAAHMKDIFPVVFHDGTLEPATNAARAVLATAK